MTNFFFLKEKTTYALFAPACIEAERIFAASPAMCAVGCRKALELAVKWVYAADTSMEMPYRDNLQSLLHEPSFRFAVDRNTWANCPLSPSWAMKPYIRGITSRRVTPFCASNPFLNSSSGSTIAMAPPTKNGSLTLPVSLPRKSLWM